MGIFSPDFASVDASIPIYEKGRYRVQVTKKKPVIKEVKDKKTGNIIEQAFMQYNLEMKGQYDDKGQLVTEGFDGRSVSPFKCFIHTEGGWQFSKPFLMAASGFDVKKEEQKANAELFQTHNWMINGAAGSPPENIEVGEGWELPVNRLVDVTLQKKVSEVDGTVYENQDYGNWAPVK